MSDKINQVIRMPLLLCILMLFSGISGCPIRTKETCLQSVERFRLEVQEFPPETESSIFLDEPDRDPWMRWAERWLQRLQGMLDRAQLLGHKRAATGINRVLNHLVIFHGHVFRGETARAYTLLRESQQIFTEFVEKECSIPEPKQ